MATTTTLDPVFRPPQAADYIGLSASTLAKLRCIGDGPTFIRLTAKSVGYRQSDLDAWVEGKRRTSTSDAGTA